MTTKLYASGGSEVVIPTPDEGFERPTMRVGGQARMLDGSLRQHIAARKRRWSLTWKHLDDTDLSTLKTQLELGTALTFKPPDETSTYTVLVTGEIGITATQFGWTVQATLEEV